MFYVSVADITNAWVTWSDLYKESLIDECEALFHEKIWMPSWESFISTSYTEKIAPKEYVWKEFWKFFILWRHFITSLTSIDWTSISSWDYELEWRMLSLKNPVTIKTEFPYKNSFVYVSWFASNAVPKDIKMWIISLCVYRSKTRNMDWVKSFRQDLLSVEFQEGWSSQFMEKDFLLKSLFQKYTSYYVSSL